MPTLPKEFLPLEDHLYLRPLGGYHQRGVRTPFYELAIRMGQGRVERTDMTQFELMDWAGDQGEDVVVHLGSLLEHLKKPVQQFAGLKIKGRPRIMGIVNVTPDSFSDGGKYLGLEAAVAHGQALMKAGADILDIGGESTRPGAAPVPVHEEINRVVPVIQALKELGATISIDTRHTRVMEAALKAGADMINDVTALSDDGALDLVAEADVPVIMMHMQGQPQTMQANPSYGDCVLDIYDYLAERLQACETAGIKRAKICIDPGIGFGKTLAHNMALITSLGQFHGLGCSVLLGASRKSFIEKICPATPAEDRLGGSLAAALKGAEQGAQIVRVHDVAETVQALKVWEYI